MKKNGIKKISLIIYIIVISLTLMFVCGGVGIYLRFSNNGTDDFKTFYVESENGNILATTDSVKAVSGDMRFNVGYTFDLLTGQSNQRGFSVQAISNALDIEYSVDGEIYKYSEGMDMSDTLNLQLYDDYFTIEMPNGVCELLQKYYDKDVEIISYSESEVQPITLIVTSYNGTSSVNIKLTLYVITPTDMEFNDSEIIF